MPVTRNLTSNRRWQHMFDSPGGTVTVVTGAGDTSVLAEWFISDSTTPPLESMMGHFFKTREEKNIGLLNGEHLFVRIASRATIVVTEA